MTDEPSGENFTDEKLRDWFDAEIEERRGKVLLYRLAGNTFSRIAAELGLSISTVRRDYELALRAQDQITPELRRNRQLVIVDDMIRANYKQMLTGDKDAAANIIKALERETKVLGLDKPIQIQPVASTSDVSNEMARLIDKIQTYDPSALDRMKEISSAQPRRQEAESVPRPIVDAEVVGEGAPADERGDGQDSQRDAGPGGPEGVAGGDQQPLHRPARDAEPADDLSDWADVDDD